MNIQAAFNIAAGDQDLKVAQKRMEYDRMPTLDIQLSWLEAAGFKNVDCWYKNFSFTVFGGYRPNI